MESFRYALLAFPFSEAGHAQLRLVAFDNLIWPRLDTHRHLKASATNRGGELPPLFFLD